MELDVTSDFATVADGLEEVTLRRRGSTSTMAVTAALRQDLTAREAEPSAGVAVESNATWHLVLGDDATPHVGDVILDANDGRWTILTVEELPRVGRWKCETRELRIAYGCGERVDIERPMWSEGEAPEIVGWMYVATALPVRIQPMEIGVDDSGEPHAKFRIILGESIELEPHDRFVAGDGAIYSLTSYEQAERIDVLPVAYVVSE